jgi:hypothetical protein
MVILCFSSCRMVTLGIEYPRHLLEERACKISQLGICTSPKSNTGLITFCLALLYPLT